MEEVWWRRLWRSKRRRTKRRRSRRWLWGGGGGSGTSICRTELPCRPSLHAGNVEAEIRRHGGVRAPELADRPEPDDRTVLPEIDGGMARGVAGRGRASAAQGPAVEARALYPDPD